MKTVKQIKTELTQVNSLDDPLLASFQNDNRKSVQLLVSSCQKRICKQEEKIKKTQQLLVFENDLYKAGMVNIAGVDEVGRGCIAGPVVAAAVIFPPGFLLSGLDDSKKLTHKLRCHFFDLIMNNAVAVGVGLIRSSVIDNVNIYEATKLAMVQAVKALAVKPDHILVDAMKIPLNYRQTAIIKGDQRSLSIAAASVIAKVTRDRLMTDYEHEYPQYGFAKHKGYGTEEHLRALADYGLTPIHRLTFAPCYNYTS